MKDVTPARTLDRGESARPNHLLVTRAAATLEGSDDILENMVGEMIESAFGLKEPALERFEASNAAIVVAEFRPKRPGHDFRYMIQKPVPSHIGPIVGDVVSNLRSSLEHVVTELTITNVGHELEGTAFPVSTTRQAWDQVSKKAGTFAPNTGRYKLRGVPYRALLLIRKNQPFRWKRYQRNELDFPVLAPGIRPVSALSGPDSSSRGRF